MSNLEQVKEYRSRVCDVHREHQEGKLSLDDCTEAMEKLDTQYGMDFSAAGEADFHAESFFSDIGDRFKHIPQDLDPNRIKEVIRHEFQDVLKSSAGVVARQAFKQAAGLAHKTYAKMKAFRESHPNLVAAIDTLGISLSLSVVTFHYDRFYGRAEGLTRLLSVQSEHFEFTRHSVRWILENSGPKSVDINIFGEIFTSAISAGVGVHGELSLMVELVDMALSHAGVPE